MHYVYCLYFCLVFRDEQEFDVNLVLAAQLPNHDLTSP
jgi:hypothetical protein